MFAIKKPFGYRIIAVCTSFIAITITVVLYNSQNDKRRRQIAAPQIVTDVLPSRQKLLDEITGETTAQTVSSLPSILDRALALAGSGTDSIAFNGSYKEAQRTYPRMLRVRKLLNDIPVHERDKYSAEFIEKIYEAFNNYDQDKKSYDSVVESSKGQYFYTTPPDHQKKRATAGSLIYVLTEWDRIDALPAFANWLSQPDPIPVNRLFVIYSCHVLVASIPTERLSTQQLTKLNHYKKATKDSLPLVEKTKVAAWNAKYDESDYRKIILHQNVPIGSEPAIELRRYPDLKNLENYKGDLSEEGDVLQRNLLEFLRSL